MVRRRAEPLLGGVVSRKASDERERAADAWPNRANVVWPRPLDGPSNPRYSACRSGEPDQIPLSPDGLGKEGPQESSWPSWRCGYRARLSQQACASKQPRVRRRGSFLAQLHTERGEPVATEREASTWSRRSQPEPIRRLAADSHPCYGSRRGPLLAEDKVQPVDRLHGWRHSMVFSSYLDLFSSPTLISGHRSMLNAGNRRGGSTVYSELPSRRVRFLFSR